MCLSVVCRSCAPRDREVEKTETGKRGGVADFTRLHGKVASLDCANLKLEVEDHKWPKLDIADRLLDAKFAREHAISIDMEEVNNATKTSGTVYENLAHYLFNNMIHAHTLSNDFDLLSPWTWLSIIGWIASAIALVLVVISRINLRSLSLLLMARGPHAAPLGSFQIPRLLSFTTVAPVTQPAVDIIAEWMKHVAHVPNLLPAEVLILLCLIFDFLFKLACMIYRSRREQTVRTCLLLEIGNGVDTVLIPAINLPHVSRYYRLCINRMAVKF